MMVSKTPALRNASGADQAESGRFLARCSSAEEILLALREGFMLKATVVDIALKDNCTIICNSIMDNGACGKTAFPAIPAVAFVRIRGNHASFCRAVTNGPSSDTPLISPAYRYFEVYGRLELVDVELTGGFAKESNGGGVYVHPGGELLLSGSTIRACASTGSKGFPGSTRFGAGGGEPALGGAIHAERAKLELRRCKFIENCAYGGKGGSILSSRTVAHDIQVERARSMRPGKRVGLGTGGNGGNAKICAQEGGLFGGHGGLVLKETPSAGGGGAALGGAVFARECSVLIQSCLFDGNKCVPGEGGVQAWGHPNGRDGSAVGGAIFTWGSSSERSVLIEPICRFLRNEAQHFPNEFDRFIANEVRLAPKLLFKPTFTWPQISDKLLAAHTSIRLPIFIVRKILEEYVDWVIPHSTQAFDSSLRTTSHSPARLLQCPIPRTDHVHRHLPLTAHS